MSLGKGGSQPQELCDERGLFCDERDK